MNSTTTTTTTFNYAAFLANVTVQFNRYVPIPLLLFGLVGNTLNVFVFRRRSLRSNPCSVCFIAASLVNLLVLFDGLVPRILLSFQRDPADTSTFLCKLKYYILYASSAVSSWFIVLATIDRYLSSSLNALTRQLSTFRRTRRFIIGLTLFSSVFFIDKLVCFEANIPNEVLKCNSIQGICRNYHDYSYIIVYSTGPCIMLGIFGTLTIRNVRKRTRIILPQPRVQQISNTKRPIRAMIPRDLQLVSMLLIQVVFLILFSFPISIVRIYLGLTFSIPKTSLRLSQESFVLQLVIMLTYIPIIDTFYIYTITGKAFRKELRLMMYSWLRVIGIHIHNGTDDRQTRTISTIRRT